ncbi:hypothetical protein [Kribbella sp. NPDC023855]|uniref:hypothetical protein n=1 Tax=Kribbella sp. NPDC023855 TaxID=3154698 RepID=UPI0033C8CB51
MKKLLFSYEGTARVDLASAIAWHRKKLAGYDVQESVDGAVFSYQGGWWYRGETTVEPDPVGVRVTYRVFNVADRLTWAVPLANRFFIGARAQYGQAFEAGLRQLEADAGGRSA